MANRPVAVVTGAASGIGRELALRLAKLGYDLTALDADAPGLEALAGQVKTRCRTHTMDVADAISWAEVAGALEGRRVGVLVNNAGLLLAGRLTDCAADELRRLLDVNLLGVMLGCRAVVPALRRSIDQIPRRERPLPIGVLNIASVFARIAPPGFSAYNATKAGVVTLSETLRGELRSDGLSVTAVMPGVTATGLFDRAHYADDRLREATGDYLARAELSPGDVADAALRAYRRRRRAVTIGRRARRFALAKRWAPGLVGWAIARRARRVLE